jgi:hypothetical protein
MRHHRFADRPEGISNYFDWVRLMDTEHLPELTPPFKQGTRRMLVTTLLYFLYLATSFAALCYYLEQTQHVTAYLIITAWLISVLLVPIPRQLLLNRRKNAR